jgi:hypothetical protein
VRLLYWVTGQKGDRIRIDEFVPFRYTPTRFGGHQHVPEARASLPTVVWRPIFPMSAMPWLGIRLSEYEPRATRHASRRQDREPAARHVRNH